MKLTSEYRTILSALETSKYMAEYHGHKTIKKEIETAIVELKALLPVD